MATILPIKNIKSLTSYSLWCERSFQFSIITEKAYLLDVFARIFLSSGLFDPSI